MIGVISASKLTSYSHIINNEVIIAKRNFRFLMNFNNFALIICLNELNT